MHELAELARLRKDVPAARTDAALARLAEAMATTAPAADPAADCTVGDA